MLNEGTYYSATAAAQAIMGQAQNISVDGKWGRFTADAYKKASPDVRVKVEAVVRALTGASPSELATYRRYQRSKGEQLTSVAHSDIKKLITAVALREGVPPVTALKIADLESKFNPKAVSPTGAKGLFQLTSVAVQDVQERLGYTPTRDLFDPEENALVGIKYMKLVSRDLKVPLTDTVRIYMGFNIGPTGARHVLAGEPEKARKQIMRQAYGSVDKYESNLATAVNRAVSA